MNSFEREFIRKFGYSDYNKGVDYNPDYITQSKKVIDGLKRHIYFNVKSERTNKHYEVKTTIDIEKKQITDYNCNCPQFYLHDMCKHVAACLLQKHDDLLNNQNDEEAKKYYGLKATQNILNNFYKPKTNKIRKKLQLEITLDEYDSWYYGSGINVNLKMGETRLYTLKGKYGKFMNAYRNEQSYKFTTKFTYDPEEHYFSEEDTKILNFFSEHTSNDSYRDGYSLNDGIAPAFLTLLEEKDFIVENQKYHGFKKQNPFDIRLSKKDDTYYLTIQNMKNMTPLYPSSDFVYDKTSLYKLPKKVSELYKQMKHENIDTLVFKDEDLSKFTSGVLQIIKENVTVDQSASNIVIVTKPESKLYFDFYYNAIECTVKLIYGEKIINIFDKTNEISRDNNYETTILEKLNELGFIKDEEKQKLLLEDIDQIGYFLEEDLDDLSKEYDVYTSQKIKDTNILKNTNASANFSIGTDNIMSYNFKVEGVTQNELSDLIDSMHKRKKYYRLKSGSLLNLEDNKQLAELSALADDMELTGSNIEEGTLPKYRAIYFDSLKNNRYQNIIETNNLFNDLINNFNAYKDVNIKLPKKELDILRDYQKIGVKWLYNIYKCGFGGILADEMGLGKSIQLIYLIKLIIKENKNAKILIVAPTSLVYNWKKEFDKFGSELNYKVFAENKEQRLNSLDNAEDINIFITTYGLIRNDEEKYKEMHFNLLAIDEAQNIKNPKAAMTKVVKSLNADTKIALTGTPLENSVMELWSIFDFIMPGYLATNKKFQSLYNVSDVDEESIHRLDNLNMQIKYFILRRKKKDVVKELPDKIENNIYVDLGKEQKTIYAAEVQKTKEEIDTLMATEGFNSARFKILTLITRLRQICIDPSIVYTNYKGGRAKIEQLSQIVKEAKENGHKVLIFTTYKTALDLAIKELTNNGISSYYIDGSVPSKKRMELVDKFNNDDTDAFLITLKAGGTGLNLTSATVVIHLDLWWNPQVENQATDRAHRIGQKNTVEVIRLIATGTIEERILELQEKKKKLADALIEGDSRSKNQLSNLTEKDIQMLLSMDNDENVRQ